MWLTRLALRNPVFILMMSLMTVVLGLRVAAPAQRRPVPRDQHPGHPRRDLLHGRRPGRHREDDHPADRARGRRVARRRPRREQSQQGFSSVSVWFNYGVNLDNAQFEVSQRVAQILNTLPPGIQQPFIIKFDITNIPVVQIAVSGEGSTSGSSTTSPTTPSSRRSSASTASPAPTSGGGQIREIEVKVNRDALRARNLGILDVVDAVRAVEPAAAERPPARRRPRLQRLLEHAGREGAAARAT